jgi:hypothetical protein
MSGDCDEVESEVVLPAGMELVVPPRARDEAEPAESPRRRGAGRRAGGSTERASFPPFAHRGERRAPVT